MGKRGQVYILAAIILAIILFSLAAIRNKFEQEEMRGDFDALSENYHIESSKLINSVIESGGDVHESFKSFSTMFTAYAKGKNPRYGLIYVLGFENKIQITNFFNNPITIQGCGYSVTVPGYFSKVPADLSFEGFNIEQDINWGEVQVECEDLTEELTPPLPPEGMDIPVSNKFCAFVPPTSGETELVVVIDGAPYSLCIEEGVPELMQVSMMKQGEQAKVSGTGKCIGQDFCSGFTIQNDCEVKCGEDVCCWWGISEEIGTCLSNYSYSARCSGECVDEGMEFCYGNDVWDYDSCGTPISKSIECSSDEVCRDELDKKDLATQCCNKEDHPGCYDGNIHWFSECGTEEGLIDECGSGRSCYDTGEGPSCCDLTYEIRCYGNDIHYYSDCETKEDFIMACSGDFDICRDPYYTGGGILPTEAVCCIQNFEQTCYENDLYYYSSCGTREDLSEDCSRFCDDQEIRCCESLDGQACSDDNNFVCDYYDDCGNKADCNVDCREQDMTCACDDLGCRCTEIRIQCVSQTYYTNDCDQCVGSCNEEEDCESLLRCTPQGHMFAGIQKRSGCGFMGMNEKCRIFCVEVIDSECSVSPSCPEGYSPSGNPVPC